MENTKIGIKDLLRNFFTSADAQKGAEIPGFRHKTHEARYARLALPFCRQDSIAKLAVLLEEEAIRVNRNTSR